MANKNIVKREVDVRGLFCDYLWEDFGDYDSAIVTGKFMDLVGEGLDRVEGEMFLGICAGRCRSVAIVVMIGLSITLIIWVSFFV